MKTAIWTDPIVAETRQWREELLRDAGYDLTQLVKQLMDTQTRHGDKLLSLEPENIQVDRLDIGNQA